MQPNSRDIAGSRLEFLDALRGIAVLFVMVIHGLEQILSHDALFVRWFAVWFDLAHFGVMLFFVTSGFVIPISLGRSTLRRFWLRRCLRLYPMYLFTLALAAALIAAGVYAPPNDQFALMPVRSILANATMLQTFMGVFHIIPAFWSLVPELVFYVLISALIGLGLFARSVPIAAGLIVAAAVVEGVLPRFGWAHIPLLQFVALMMTGTVLYRASTGATSRRQALAICVLCIVMIALIPAPFSTYTARLATVPCFLLILYWRPQPRVLVYLGTISYSLYLLHSLVIAVLHTGDGRRDFLLWMTCSLVIASASYRWIERPAIRADRLLGTSTRPSAAEIADHPSTQTPHLQR
jgi:peptidoglycan/LPS O-acetylase OafA/YrhL